MSRITGIAVLLLAALLEAGGDALMRVGLYKHLPGQRALFFALAAGGLFAYGWTVNAPPPWDFGKLIGIYVVFFFLIAQLIGSPQRSFIPAVRRRRFESVGKELKKGIGVVAGEHMVRSVHVSATPGRNPYHRHIVADALELVDGLFKRKVIQFGMDHDCVNVWKSMQKL
jgi:small multidrug resistance family-3 protein